MAGACDTSFSGKTAVLAKKKEVVLEPIKGRPVTVNGRQHYTACFVTYEASVGQFCKTLYLIGILSNEASILVILKDGLDNSGCQPVRRSRLNQELDSEAISVKSLEVLGYIVLEVYDTTDGVGISHLLNNFEENLNLMKMIKA